MNNMISSITVMKFDVIQRSFVSVQRRNLRAVISTFRQSYSSRPEAHNTGASQKIANVQIQTLKFFASTLPGLEKLVYNELLSIGVEGIKVNQNDAIIGGVHFRASCLEDVMKCHLHLGAVSHIYLRASDPFVATGMEELVRKVANMDFWRRYLYSRNGSLPLLDIRVTASKSRLYHTKGIAERVERGILNAMKIDCEAYASKKETSDKNAEKLRILVRIVQNQVEISVDTACTPLHRRGYRLQTGKAPLREDLAFAFLRAQGWCWNSAFGGLLDPMCGSGTLLIEGASMASGLPPGRLRPPPFKHSQLWDEELWKDIVDSTLAQANEYKDKQKGPVIIGSDRDKGVIEAATENIKRAGLEDMIELHNCSISDNPLFTDSASYKLQNMLLVTNPPYGVRVSPSKKIQKRKIHPLLPLYQTLGRCSNGIAPRVNFGIIAHDVNLARQTGVENLTSLFTTLHGGLRVTALSTICKPYFSTAASLALKS